MNKEYIAKVLIIGEAKVGKTSLLTRYTEGKFETDLMPTLGIDYRLKKVILNDKQIKLQIWDTAGQERFRSITQNFYKGAMGILLVFDLNDQTSFENLQGWLESIKTFSGSDVILQVVGNKSDLKQEISQEILEQFEKDKQFKLIKTSAKTSEGIESVFTHVAEQINEKFFNIMEESSIFGTKDTIQPKQGLQAGQHQSKKRYCC